MPIFQSGVTPLTKLSFAIYASLFRFWFPCPVTLAYNQIEDSDDKRKRIVSASSSVSPSSSKTSITKDLEEKLLSLQQVNQHWKLIPWIGLQIIFMLLAGFGSCMYSVVKLIVDPSMNLPVANICILFLDVVVNSFYFFIIFSCQMFWNEMLEAFNEMMKIEYKLTQGTKEQLKHLNIPAKLTLILFLQNLTKELIINPLFLNLN